jgi:dTDP-4-dehydrorhamnose 3,5-epimerase
MKKISTELEGVYILEPKVFGDERGYFFESYNETIFQELGLNYKFVQDNESFSSYGTLRGLHFQKGEFAQAKLVRAVKGTVLDVAVDIRNASPTFGKHVAVELSESNKRMLMIPRGFAHGFVVLSESAVFQYKCDNFYSPQNEGGIAWDDPSLGINWFVKGSDVKLSIKDQKNKFIQEIDSF